MTQSINHLIKETVYRTIPEAIDHTVFTDKRKSYKRMKFCGVVGTQENIAKVWNALHVAGLDVAVGATGPGITNFSAEKLTVKFDFS